MFKKFSFLFVGLICSVLCLGQANAQTQQSNSDTQLSVSSQQQIPNNDAFNFVIANPNTVDPKKFIFEIKPGEQNSDYVYVKNASSVPLHFSLYGVDGTQTAQGSFALKTKNETKQQVGKWITFDNPEIDLQPGEIQKEKFTIAIPSDTPEGNYSGGVAAEKVKPDSVNPSVLIAVRIGLRVDVKVTANPQPVTKQNADVTDNSWFQSYFWISLIAFIISVALLGWSYLGNKKTKKGRH